jgi:hypothetical protein
MNRRKLSIVSLFFLTITSRARASIRGAEFRLHQTRRGFFRDRRRIWTRMTDAMWRESYSDSPAEASVVTF